MANVFKDTCIKLQVSVLRLKDNIWNIWYTIPAVQFIWRTCWIWWTERLPQNSFNKILPYSILIHMMTILQKVSKKRPSLWEWAGWILGHSALFLSLLWAFSSPQRYHQSINTAIYRWIILSSSINTLPHDRCFLDKKKRFPDPRSILRWWLCSLLIHAHLSSWHQGASSATSFYSVILQKQSLWGGGGSS